MAADRGGFIFDPLLGGGIDRSSPSIKRCPSRIDIVRMQGLAHVSVDFSAEYYGDLLTWWDLAAVGLTNGSNTTVLYSRLEVGWTYDYDAVSNIFTVTDNNGNAISRKVKTISDMGIVWEILSSHQFKIFFSATSMSEAFLTGWIKKRGYVREAGDGTIVWPPKAGYTESPIPDNAGDIEKSILAYVDQFFNETLHWKCNRFVKKQKDVPELDNTISQKLTGVGKAEILRSKVPVRSTTGDYTDMAIYSQYEKHALPIKQRNAIIDIILGEFLMIAFFASIHNMSKPVYEPWMLLGIWKWLCSSEPLEAIDRIFDLSPRW